MSLQNEIHGMMPTYEDYPADLRPYNDQDQYPSPDEFEAIIQDYLSNLSSKKRDKALIDQARYTMILQVLKDPRNTAVSTAQFRFWVKKMFQLSQKQIVCHDGKPVAMREQIYGILVRAHREAHHGGRDKTSALVRRRYSWIPKELIARFVRHCPFCISRRNGNQQSPVSLGIFLPATPPSYNLMPMEERARAPSMAATNSTASSSYPEEMLMGPPSQEGTMGLQWQQPHCYPPNAYYDYKPNPVYSQIDMVDSSVRMLLSQKSGLVSPSSALSPSSSTLSSPAYRNLAPPVQLLSHF